MKEFNKTRELNKLRLKNNWVQGEDAYIGISFNRQSSGSGGTVYLNLGYDILSHRTYYSSGYSINILGDFKPNGEMAIYAIWQVD